ncbi:MAG: protein kinase [Proteobacteria bacterium]|nr:protein kinase [Pseudomonadota bacterium]
MLGYGGFATVWAARRVADGRAVALKVADPYRRSAAVMLRREIAVLRAVANPFVPEVYDSGDLADGTPYVACELIRIRSLDALLADQEGPLEGQTFAVRAIALVDALTAIHQRGVVHGDLKPENIFLQENHGSGSGPAIAKIIDFGLARQLSRSHLSQPGECDGLAREGAILGTPDYMSPEQCEGCHDIDQRSDIYTIGVVLYEMLTARTPFFGRQARVLDAHLGYRPPLPSTIAPVPSSLDRVLIRCLAKSPQRRFQTAAALKHALTTALADDRPSDKSLREVRSARDSRAANGARKRVGMVVFESDAPASLLQEIIIGYSGRIASLAEQRCVAVFDAATSENPVRRAQRCAEELIARSVTESVAVDCARVRVQKRADGSQRFLSPTLFRKGRSPARGARISGHRNARPDSDCPATDSGQEAAQPGVSFTEMAIEALGGAYSQNPARSERSTLPPGVNAAGPATPGRPGVRPIPLGSATHISLEVESDGSGDVTDLPVDLRPLIGRDAQRGELVASAHRASRERIPTIATVLAEKGYGKSHLAEQLVADLSEQVPGARVWHMHAREGAAGECLRHLVALVMGLSDSADRADLVSAIRSGLGHPGDEDAGLAVAVAAGWMSAEQAGLQRLAAAPGALRLATTRSVGQALRSEAGREPICLVVDDAHLTDDITLDILEHAALAEARAPLWICVLARPGFATARPSWSKRAGLSTRLELGPLDRESTERLCRQLLLPAENVAASVVEQLVRRVRGSPFLLVELVRGLKRSGLVHPRPSGSGWMVATDLLASIPDLPVVEWLADGELRSLSVDLAAHARLVALLGNVVDIVDVEGVLGELDAAGLGVLFPVDGEVGMLRLAEDGILSVDRDGRYGFRHTVIRDQLTRSLPAALRKGIHDSAFRFYRRDDTLDDGYRLVRLAHHAGQGGRRDEAAVLYSDLGERARRRHDYLEAELMFHRAIELGQLDESNGGQLALGCHQGRGLMRARLGRYDAALTDLDRAERIANQRDDIATEVEILLDKAMIRDWIGDYREAEILVERAELRSTTLDAPHLEARLLLGRACIHWRLSRLNTAADLLMRSVRRSEALGDRSYETNVVALLVLATIRSAQYWLDEAEDLFERVIALCNEHGDMIHLAAALNNRQDHWAARKDIERAIADALRTRQIARELGQAEAEYVSEFNLAELHYYYGDLEAARPHVDRARELEAMISPKPLATLLAARWLLFQGRAAEAHELVCDIRTPGSKAEWVPREQVQLDMVELATSGASEARWADLRARAAKYCHLLWEHVEVVEAQALAHWRSGQLDRAVAALEEAAKLAGQRPHLIHYRLERALRRVRDELARGRPAQDGAAKNQLCWYTKGSTAGTGQAATEVDSPINRHTEIDSESDFRVRTDIQR